MTKVSKEQLLEFIRNNELDLDESYPRSDWWKFRNERDAYKKQRDEFRLKAEAYERIKKAYFDNDNYSDEQFMELIEETIEGIESNLECDNNVED